MKNLKRNPPYRFLPGSHQRRGAVLTTEMLFVLPVFGLVLTGAVELGLLAQARNLVQLASIEGARAAVASYPHPSQREQAIRNAVARVLVKPQLVNRAQIFLTGGDHPGEPVTVIVQVPMDAAAPDLLAVIGISLQGRWLVAQATMTQL